MKVTFEPEQNVGTYNLVIDGGAPIPVPPNADGTANFDLDSLNLPPGDHVVSADACNASGCSAFCEAVSFNVPVPIPVPGVPVITVA